MSRPKIRTLDQADDALREIAELNGHIETVHTKYDAKAAALKDEQAAALLMPTETGTQKAEVLRDELIESVAEFCRKNPHLVREGEARSIKLNHGTLGFRMAPARIEDIDPKPTAAVTGLAKVLRYLMGRLAGLAWLKGVTTDQVITVKVCVDKSACLEKRKSGHLTNDQLKQLGVRYVPPHDEPVIKPNAAIVRGKLDKKRAKSTRF